MKYNSLYVEVRGLANNNSFDVGPVRVDKRGTYRVFTIYEKHPWQGVLEWNTCEGVPGWYYFGTCWPL